MRFLGAMVMMAAGTAVAADDAARGLAVCMNLGSNVQLIRRAQATAGNILREAGVKIEWRNSVNRCSGPERSIVIETSAKTAADRHRGAFAYAQPFQGTHVVLFIDRMVNMTQAEKLPGVLGHVLAHEITHMLQGVVRHSASGVMKPSWDFLDHGNMQSRNLHLTDEDIDLIKLGMDGKAIQMAAFRPAE